MKVRALATMSITRLWKVLILVGGFVCLTESYLAVVPKDLPPGTTIFEAGVPRLGGRRRYQVSNDRTARFARKLLRVNAHTGRVSLARSLDCDGVRYPSLFTFYIDSTSTRLGRPIIDYYSLPLRIIVTGCGSENEDLAATRRWTAETLASYAMPSNDKFTEICLRSSQFVAALRDFLPHTAITECDAHWNGVADPRFLVEGAGGDLVSSSEQCIVDPLWKITVSVTLRCSATHLADTEHRFKIIFHHQRLDDTDLGRRVRRELRNKSPFFEHGLYIAAVEEEKDAGEPVTIVRAKDPEGGALRYTMMSLLDARSSALFLLDSQTGRVTTRARLDRENVEVHYFKILAVDDAFPPRTGTTTLQVNVLDANDHAPTFELLDYEAPVREGVPVGSTVVAVKATDKDFGRNAEVEYSIVSTTATTTKTGDADTALGGEDGSTFRVDPRSGVVTTRLPLDRETTESYTVVIRATDLANAPAIRRSASTTLVVRILDDNDNYPQFTERTYSVTVPEDLDYTTNPVIAGIRATDADSGANAAVRYTIIGGNTHNAFSIDSPSGDVTLVKPLDYETTDLYRLVIRAQDGGSPTRSNTTQLIVHVRDINDNAPRFFTSQLQEAISESVPVGTSVLRVQAYDGDKGLNALVRYSIGARDLSGASTEHFPIAVNPETGWIHTTRQLDREQCSRYQFTVVATDSGEQPRSGSATVVITVSDVNDNDPTFEPKSYEALVSEDDPPGTPVASVTATDPDEDGKIRYEITAGNTRGRFSITSQNGIGHVTVAQPLDYKQEKRFVITVTAADSGGRTDTALVYVNVTDANNFAPVFENAPYSVAVFEDAPVGTTVLVVSATDSDVGQNARITYSLGSDGNDGDIAEFAINSQTGAITTVETLDREKLSGYVLTVTAKDGGVPPLSDTTEVEISVTDVNDNAPIFDAGRYQGSVPEDVVVGTWVTRVSATDADQGLNGRVRYAFEDDGDGAFAIDPTTGAVRTAKQLDRESVATYDLKALAIDRGIPSLSSSVPIVIKIEDVNDSPPAFESDKIVLFVAENSPIGSTIGEIRAHDPDEGPNAVIQYSIIGGEDAGAFSLNARPGYDKAELTTREELDYESPRKKFEIFVRASSPPLRSDVLVQIMVTDVNDNAPVLKDFHVIFNNFKDFFPSAPIGRIPAFDADVTDKLVYAILSGNGANLITLDRDTGEMSLSPQLNTNVARVATMEVSVSDGVNEAKATMTMSIRLITDRMLLNSITVRLEDMTVEAFLSPLLGYFVDGLAAIVPCPRENIFVFGIQEDSDVNGKILNVSFSARRVEPGNSDEFYTPQYLQERVYLNRGILARLAVVTVLPFDDNLCVREPCLNYEECLTVLKFGNASGFASSDTVLFRPIYPVTTFSCRCPKGFTGSREAYLCDTEVNLCYSNPCKNGGTCQRREGGYTCACRPDTTGRDCEVSLEKDACPANEEPVCAGGSRCSTRMIDSDPGGGGGGFTCEGCPITALESATPFCELRARSFGPATFLTFPSLRQRHRLRLRLRFATESRDGLLLYNGRYNEKHDFVALEIVESSVQFSFSLGDEITRATASIPGGVSDGQWHEVRVDYFNRTVAVSLDDCDVALALRHGDKLGDEWSCAATGALVLEERCSHPTETCHRFLDLTGPLQLGGLPSIPSSFQTRSKDFVGCIGDFRIDDRFVDLDSFVADNGTRVGCPEKLAFCDRVPAPCLNDGKCREIWSGYVCECEEGYAGARCEDEIGKPWRFSGDGLLSFNPLLRPIQLPWTTALSLRTRGNAAFVMSIQIGQNSSAAFCLDDGRLSASLDGADIISTAVPINDGEWHRVEVVWHSGHVSLDMDYRDRPIVSPLLAKLQGLYVGRILLGGPDRTNGLQINSDDPATLSFDGCLQDLRVGTNQSVLQRPTVQENVGVGCATESQCSTAAAADCPETSVCLAKWRATECTCEPGTVGQGCQEICRMNPCHGESGRCVQDRESKKGYRCECTSDEYSGEYCEIRVDQPCPATWWGSPVCGPCHCDESKGYDPSCNKTTGECYCKENHYQPSGQDECIPCECYEIGSYGPRCNTETGQCRCRTGVIGRSCTNCPNPYAEVTEDGCRVVYDGCPRSYSAGIWWPRMKFGAIAVEDCPGTAEGRASRSCDDSLGGWQHPDLFNCTSEAFVEERQKLAALENGRLHLDRDTVVKLAADVRAAVDLTRNMYGADVLVAESLLSVLLRYEENLADLGLTHNQDKDYVPNLVGIAGAVLSKRNIDNWRRIEELNGDGPDKILDAVARYLKILTASQHDTFTEPFEVVDSNVVMGLDTVTSESLFGYEAPEYREDATRSTARPSEADRRVVIPDTSSFLTSPARLGPYVTFPKYNNYMADPRRFDPYSKIRVPLRLLGIRPLTHGELNEAGENHNNEKAVLSYVQYRELGALLPKRFDDSVNVRWGVEVAVGSPVVTVSLLIPSENGTRSLAESALEAPVRIQLWIIEDDGVKQRANPQCVHWSMARGIGEWSRIGCTTELEDATYAGRQMVNCSCQGVILELQNLQLATFAVLTDVLDLEYVPEPSLLEDVTSYSAFMLALPLLLTTLLILALIRGGGTNSNSIHENLVFCVFLAETLYLVALKARGPLVTNVFPCKLTAIGLHYAWLSTFSWTLVDSIHLYRMLTEMRDVNHGHMRFYYTVGYGLPAVIVGLTIGVRADQYGNFYFCWLSIYETVVWALIGPVCAAVLINFCILLMSVRAAFTLKEHIMGFGNLRTLLWLSVVSLPLLGTTWTLAVLNASENSPMLSYLLSVSVVTHAAFSLIGYCFVNGRVRRNLYHSLLRCVGKKSPLLDGSTGNASSSQNVNGQSRSALAYSSAYSGADSTTCRRVHVGVSTSSTTSRSTTKTGSSPYRSDAHLRHTSTSTSNYNSDRDPYVSSRSHRGTLHPRQGGGESCGARRDSESDSDVSQADDGGEGASCGGAGGGSGRSGGRSLDLASSHSSDDEDVTSRSHKNMGVSTQQPVSHSYLPNIHENAGQHLNILCSNSELFPNIKPIYAPRWSSQLPEAYLPPNDIRTSQWSGGTISDNEMASNKTSSPNPLPYPDMVMPHKLQPDDNCSESEEKHHHVGEKYLFPYTAEEDHTVSPTPYMLSMTSRILGSSMSHHSQNSNHDNHSGSERYGSLKRGRSLHGSQHDNIGNSERYGSLKRGKMPTSVMHDTPDYILPMSGRILSSSLSHDLHHSNELATLRQQQMQHQQQQQQQQVQHYDQTITETEKDINAETPV